MNLLKTKYAAISRKARQAFWLVLAVAVLLLGFGVYAIPRIFTGSFTMQNLSNGMIPIIGLLALLSAYLIFDGKESLGGQIFIAAFTVGMVFEVAVVANLGFLFAALVFVITSILTSQTFKDRGANSGPMIGYFIALFIILVDTFAGWFRDIPNAQDTTIATALGGTIVLIYLLFLGRQYNQQPLRSKLVLVFLATAIIPVVIAGYVSNYLTERALLNDGNKSLAGSASQVASLLDNFIFNSMDNARVEAQLSDFATFLSMTPEERPGSETEEHVYRAFEALRNRNPLMIDSYSLLDKNGIDIANTKTDELGSNKSNRDYFKYSMETGLPFFSPIEISPILKTYVIFVSAPVRSTDGDIVGVLRYRYDASVIQQVLTQGIGSEGNYFAMVVSDNQIIFGDTVDPNLVYKSITPIDNARAQVLKSKNLMPEGVQMEQMYAGKPDVAQGLAGIMKSGFFTGDLHTGGSASVEQAGVVTMKNRPWYVIVATSRDALLAPVQQQSRSATVIGIIVSLLASVFGLIIAQLISNPVSHLTVTANRVASGDLAARSDVRTGDEVGELAKTFNLMAEQLSNLIGSLEQRVADRTKALATSTDVSRRLSTILDQDVLVKEVVEQLKQAFNYYHVHIYLFDERKESLMMAGGTGEAGQTMLARGHKIPAGRGLVGRAADTGMSVIVPDVTKAEGWLPNPLLPETKSELAVPIAIGENVLGVLDVQQNQTGGLQQEDADLLQSIANQVAVALQNARTYAQTQRRANREALMAAIGQRIQRTTTTEEALQVAVREMGRALSAENVYIKVGAPKRNGNE
jgi:putative methionine-R-sulfoxide reductase with GAF domain